MFETENESENKSYANTADGSIFQLITSTGNTIVVDLGEGNTGHTSLTYTTLGKEIVFYEEQKECDPNIIHFISENEIREDIRKALTRPVPIVSIRIRERRDVEHLKALLDYVLDTFNQEDKIKWACTCSGDKSSSSNTAVSADTNTVINVTEEEEEATGNE